MKNLFAAICLFFISQVTIGQTKTDLFVAENFKKTDNDSLFLSKNSALPYTVFEIKAPVLGGELNQETKFAFSLKPNQVYGPFETDSFYVWVKAIQIDSIYKMRAGNIYINPNLSSPGKARSAAQEVISQLKKGASFDDMCKKYNTDSNKNKDCDLGWFYQGQMLKTFEDEILKHKKGDYFIVQTTYGFHVVKVLDNPQKDKYQVNLIQLVRRKS